MAGREVTEGMSDPDVRAGLRKVYGDIGTESGEAFPRKQMREARKYQSEQDPESGEDSAQGITRDLKQISREAAIAKGAGDAEEFRAMKRIGDIARNRRRDYARGAQQGRAIDRVYGR